MKNMQLCMTLMKTSAFFFKIITEKVMGMARMTGASMAQRGTLSHRIKNKVRDWNVNIKFWIKMTETKCESYE